MSEFANRYRDPKWQRKRLEVMEAAKFACQECGDTETTLNVHHRQYRKGAMPWEYENRELMCLCEPCHKKNHDCRKAIDNLLSNTDMFFVPAAHALLVGYMGGIVKDDGVPDKYVTDVLFDDSIKHYKLGSLCEWFNDLSEESIDELKDLFNLLNPDGFSDFVKTELSKLKGGNGAIDK